MQPGGFDRSFAVYRGGAFLFRALPRRLALRIGGLGGALAASRGVGSPEVVADNLRHVLGQVPQRELDAAVRRAYIEYGRYWAVTARLRPRDVRRLGKLVVAEGLEHFDLARRSGVIFALPHLGAWEVGGFWAANQGISLTTVAEPASSPRLSEFFSSARLALGLHLVELGPRAGTELLGVLRGGGSVALLADRDIQGDGIEVPFFGAPARLPGGPAMLSLRSGAPIVPTGTYLEADGRVRLRFMAPLVPNRTPRLRNDVRALTAMLARSFEGLIAAAPSEWHVFQPNWTEHRVLDAGQELVTAK